MRMDVYPMWSIVKVDDTPVGIEAGRNAGCWTIGVTATGNCVGLSSREADELPAAEMQRLCDNAAQRLSGAGAHLTIPSVALLPDAIREIEQKIDRGEICF